MQTYFFMRFLPSVFLPRPSFLSHTHGWSFTLGCIAALLFCSRAAADPFAYVTNAASDTVSVINTATNMVVATIPVGDEPTAVVITPDGTKAYITNYQSLSVSVIDTASNTVSATINIGERAFEIGVSPDGTKVYVVGNDDGTPFTPVATNNVIVIDTATDMVIDRFPAGGDSNLPSGDSFAIVITPDGNSAYVTNRGSKNVSVVDLALRSVVDFIDLDDVPISLDIAPDGAKLYVGNDRGILASEDGPAIVWVIDTTTNTISETITTTTPGDDFDLAKRVPGVAITPDGAQAWVTLHEVGKIGSIDVATDTLDTTLGPIDPLLPCVDQNRAGCASGIAITPDGSKAYVTMGGISDKVAVFDIATNMLLGTVTVGMGNRPTGIAITPHDAEGPVTSFVVADPNPVVVNIPINLTATVDDTDTGGSAIASADYSIDGGSLVSMDALDGAFDEVIEDVVATIPAFPEAGVHEVCVSGEDAGGNIGSEECILLAVFDPDGGFVTGGGWIESPAGACHWEECTEDTIGKANFGFVSKYKKGATIPTGNTEFNFKAGNLNFHSDVYEWLAVNQGGTNAQYKGSGTINGALAPTGEAFKFMLWASDLDPNADDTFRIKIWYEDSGTEYVVYDNGFSQPIGGGNIKIHK